MTSYLPVFYFQTYSGDDCHDRFLNNCASARTRTRSARKFITLKIVTALNLHVPDSYSYYAVNVIMIGGTIRFIRVIEPECIEC
jgi:hypothetical protein